MVKQTKAAAGQSALAARGAVKLFMARQKALNPQGRPPEKKGEDGTI